MKINIKKHIISLKFSKQFICFVFIPCIIFSPVIYSSFQKDMQLFPNSQIKAQPITDKSSNGNSEINNYSKTSKAIKVEYTLKNKIIFPYAGILLDTSFKYLNLFKEIKIKANTNSSKSAQLYILKKLKSYTKNNVLNTYLYLEATIPFWKKQKEYIFSIKDFVIPTWWYGVNPSFLNKTIEATDFSQTDYILICCNNLQTKNIKDTLIVKEVTLLKNIRGPAKVSASLMFFYVFIILSFFIIKKYKIFSFNKLQQRIIHYQKINLEETKDQNLKLILNYMHNNYSDFELTISKVSKNIQLSESKISKIVKNNFQLTFPQFLNTIRISKAKKLLDKTSDKIIDIAFNVGYNSIDNFNKTFKKINNITPSEFRKISLIKK